MGCSIGSPYASQQVEQVENINGKALRGNKDAGPRLELPAQVPQKRALLPACSRVPLGAGRDSPSTRVPESIPPGFLEVFIFSLSSIQLIICVKEVSAPVNGDVEGTW